MKNVYLLLDENNTVIAIYDDPDLAIKMLKPVELKIERKLTIEKRSVNLDIKTIGVFK